jgi:hypothetical protein
MAATENPGWLPPRIQDGCHHEYKMAATGAEMSIEKELSQAFQ